MLYYFSETREKTAKKRKISRTVELLVEVIAIRASFRITGDYLRNYTLNRVFFHAFRSIL